MQTRRFTALVGALLTWAAIGSPASAQVSGSSGGPGGVVYAPASSCKAAGGTISYTATGAVTGSNGAVIRCPIKHEMGGYFSVHGTKGSGTSASLDSRCSYVNSSIECVLYGDEFYGYSYNAYGMNIDDLRLRTSSLTGCYWRGGNKWRCPLVRTDVTSYIEVTYFQPSGGSFSTCVIKSSDLYGEKVPTTKTFYLSSGTSSVSTSLPTVQEYFFMECDLTSGAFISTISQK